MGEDNKDFVIGFISQTVVSCDPGMLHMTPGLFTFSSHVKQLSVVENIK